MTNAVIKMEKAQLAVLDTAKLVETIDGFVRNAFRRADNASAAYEEARRIRNGFVADMSIPENREEAKRLDEAVKSALMKRDQKFKDIEDYLEEQKELFRSKGLQEDRAYKEAVVPTGELTSGGKEIFRIVKREETMEPVENDEGDSGLSVRASRSYGDRIGISFDQTRGKYNDAGLLVTQSSCSVDPEEAADMRFADACVMDD